MNDDASNPRYALVPAPERAMVKATDRLLAVASAVNDEAERERLKALLRRHPDCLGVGLSRRYPLDTNLIARFAERWTWRELSSSVVLPWSLDLIERFADRWDWDVLSDNAALPWGLDLIERFANQWDWGSDFYSSLFMNDAGLSVNTGLPWSLELIERYADRWHWGAFGLSHNTALPWSLDLIERFGDRWHWGSGGLSVNPGLPWSLELIEHYADRWNWRNGLSTNTDLPWSLELIERFADRWDWENLSENTALPWSLDLIERFADRWDWKEGLSRNTALPWSTVLIERFADRWDWKEGLSRNTALPWSTVLIERFADRWDWENLSENTALPWSLDLIERFADRWRWEFSGLSDNEALPWNLDLLERFTDRWTWGCGGGLDHRSGHPSMPDSGTFDCFLSHNSRDKPAVRALAEGLRARGISVWLDEDQLRPGIPWQPLLESGIRASWSVAVLVGADGLGPWEDLEMQAALSLAVKDGCPVIPVLLADAPAKPELPMFLSERIWVDLRPRADSGYLTPLDRLIFGITGRPGPRTAGRNDDQGRGGLSCNKALPWSLDLIGRFADRWSFDGEFGLSLNEGVPWSLDLIERFEDRWNFGWNGGARSGLELLTISHLLRREDIIELMESLPEEPVTAAGRLRKNAVLMRLGYF